MLVIKKNSRCNTNRHRPRQHVFFYPLRLLNLRPLVFCPSKKEVPTPQYHIKTYAMMQWLVAQQPKRQSPFSKGALNHSMTSYHSARRGYWNRQLHASIPSAPSNPSQLAGRIDESCIPSPTEFHCAFRRSRTWKPWRELTSLNTKYDSILYEQEQHAHGDI